MRRRFNRPTFRKPRRLSRNVRRRRRRRRRRRMSLQILSILVDRLFYDPRFFNRSNFCFFEIEEEKIEQNLILFNNLEKLTVGFTK